MSYTSGIGRTLKEDWGKPNLGDCELQKTNFGEIRIWGIDGNHILGIGISANTTY